MSYDFRKLQTRPPVFTLRNLPVVRPKIDYKPIQVFFTDLKTVPHKDIIGSYRTQAVYLSNGKISILVDGRELS